MIFVTLQVSQSELQLMGKSLNGEQSLTEELDYKPAVKAEPQQLFQIKRTHGSSLPLLPLLLPSSKTQTVLSPLGSFSWAAPGALTTRRYTLQRSQHLAHKTCCVSGNLLQLIRPALRKKRERRNIHMLEATGCPECVLKDLSRREICTSRTSVQQRVQHLCQMLY